MHKVRNILNNQRGILTQVEGELNSPTCKGLVDFGVKDSEGKPLPVWCLLSILSRG